MTFFNKLFKDLIGSEDKSAFDEKGVLINEEIKHNQTFISNYESWINDGMQAGLLQHLNEMWNKRNSGNGEDVNFFLHQSKLSNGFYTRAESPWDSDDYAFFIQFIIDKFLSKNYILKNATREVIEEGGLLKTIELHYLKPSLKFRREAPFDQFFGNIEIQHRMVNGKSKIVKLMANTYSDRSYKKAYDFEDLMNFIFVL